MELEIDKGRQEVIDKVVDLIHAKVPAPKAGLIASFINKFFRTVGTDDLCKHTVPDLYGAALSFWQLIENRRREETKVHVYNPKFEINAWASTHTIIEIVADDMSFVVESVLMELNRRGIAIHLIMHISGLRICRDKDHNIVSFYGHGEEGGAECHEEVPIFLEVSRQTDNKVLEDLKKSILRIIQDVQSANEDWPLMRAKIHEAISDLQRIEQHLDKEDLSSSVAFLKWIDDNHFTYLGARDYELVADEQEQVLKSLSNTGVGVLRAASTSKVSRRLTDMTPEARQLTLSPEILIISKTNTISTVHRPVYTDYIGIKRFDSNGNVIGERRLIGLFTSSAYLASVMTIPKLREKVEQAINQSGLKPSSHAGKTLLNIIETLPRDDVFQASVAELLNISMGIYHIQERKRICIFARRDIYGRFMSCLVYVPRDKFSTKLRIAMQRYLERVFGAKESSFSTLFTDSILARIHFVLRVDATRQLDYDLKTIEKDLEEIGRTWQDEMSDTLLESHGEELGTILSQRYYNAFPSSYQEYYVPRTALYDIQHIENLSDEQPIDLNFFKPIDDLSSGLRFKIYQLGDSIPLSDVLPILENMGLRVISERPYQLLFEDGKKVWINDFGMSHKHESAIDIETIKETFQEAFAAIWANYAEKDHFNELVLCAGLNWREISMLRAYAKYFRQTGFTFSQAYIEETLANNPQITQMLVSLFHLRFDPAIDRDTNKISELETALRNAMEQVVSLDDDRILHRYFDVILATLRTNYFQMEEDGTPKSYLSFKLNPQLIPDLPLPRPMFEIFVYSTQFEGVHLRGAKVARGGLRWSDRREDFRTEVLGLMKAQQVKNSVIVPSGAKGGFVPKQLPIDGTREAIMEEGITCYKNFIRGLLDITDNLSGNDVIKPKDVYCYDEDDTYLVVAADKGTATFSDIANSIAEQYNFWLGDAFASGGSEGYDHKKMGITARGAWESVKRHFREIGHDIQTTPFTCIGIGDMSGDVFGNGMLLSRQIKLVAAFNHLHIFVDPNPDPEQSFHERERLFNLPRSSWSDYNSELISKGGGIFNRSAKSITLTPEMKALLQVEDTAMDPNQLLRAILMAPVDLLWNGGIGTFVKGVHQTHQDVGDRSNDAIRIDSDALRVKVVGEGGNLGFTQIARTEFATRGGLLYTDFIDNAGGVNCSDHEVNIKILLNGVVANGDLTNKQRSELLARMTDEVGQLVLQDNYDQALAISLAAAQAVKHIGLHTRYIDMLEQAGKLDRALEFLPDAQTLLEYKKMSKGLSRPSIAVLLSYSKMILKQEILATDLPEDPGLLDIVEAEFPLPLREKYRPQMEEHSLRREIIATQLSNRLINRAGFVFIHRLRDETGAASTVILRAYSVASRVFDLETNWRDISNLDNKFSAEDQYNMMLRLIRLMRRTTRWIIKNRRGDYLINDLVTEFTNPVQELTVLLPTVLMGEDLENYNNTIKDYLQKNMPKSLAVKLASTQGLLSALDIVESANKNNLPLGNVATVYFAIGDLLNLGWVRRHIVDHPLQSQWEVLTREALRDDLDWQQRQLTTVICTSAHPGLDLRDCCLGWVQQFETMIQRWHNMLKELQATTEITFIMFFVAVRELSEITQTSKEVPIQPPGKSKTKIKKVAGSQG